MISANSDNVPGISDKLMLVGGSSEFVHTTVNAEDNFPLPKPSISSNGVVSDNGDSSVASKSPRFDHPILPISIPCNPSGAAIKLTSEELSKFNGSDPSLPIYLAIQGFIYDVSDNRQCYEMGTGYHDLAGKDCTISFALGSPNVFYAEYPEGQGNHPSDAELLCRQRNLNDWKTYFDTRYPCIGRLVIAKLPTLNPVKEEEEDVDGEGSLCLNKDLLL